MVVRVAQQDGHDLHAGRACFPTASLKGTFQGALTEHGILAHLSPTQTHAATGCHTMTAATGCHAITEATGCHTISEATGCHTMTEAIGCQTITEATGCHTITEATGVTQS